MSDALFFAFAGLAAAVMIALAAVWPQGLGTRSPAPFGHAVRSENLDAPIQKPAGPPAQSLTGLKSSL